MGSRWRAVALAVMTSTACSCRGPSEAPSEAQRDPASLQSTPELIARARIPEIRARETVEAYLPTARIARAQLVERQGRPRYEFLLEFPDTTRPVVLAIDAETGSVCSLVPATPCSP